MRKHHNDDIWAIAESFQPDALSTCWTVLSEQMETGGFFAAVVDTDYTVLLSLVVVVCCYGLESSLSP